MNIHQYQFDQAAKMMRGTVIQKASKNVIEHLLLDSRKLTFPESTIFFAVKGERRDGHTFIGELYNKGVRAFVISLDLNISLYPDANFLKVKDTIKAAQNFAAAHRKQYNIPVIGITGSNGKTIVKEWLFQLLEPDFTIVRSPKSYNSQIGVPLSVWQMASYHNLAIFEAGISQPDEMADLEKVIQPSIGIFANIGKAHDEGFLNIRQKVNEKLKLFLKAEILIYCRDYLDVNECIAVVRDRMMKNDPDFNAFKTFSWSKNNLEADVTINNIIKHQYHTEIEALYNNKSYLFSIPFSDDASIENAIHCWMLMMYMKIDSHIISSRMMTLNKIAMRLEMKDGANNCSLINDYYNSDINSLSIAIDFLNQQKQHTKRTVILSDILQSGVSDPDLYTEVADLLTTNKVSRLIGIGNSITRQQKIFKSRKEISTSFFKSTEEFLKEFNPEIFSDETILLKGARSFEFEKISKKLEQKRHETILEINLTSLLHNLNVFQSNLNTNTKTMVMVKAFSYGSGSYEIANALQSEKVDYLAVAYADEGIELRKRGINTPIMVMNPEEKTFENIIFYKLEPVLYNVNSLEKFLQILINTKDTLSEAYPVHLEIETGMHRLGFEEKDLDEMTNIINTYKNIIKVQSVFSHLAASEDVNLDWYTDAQIEQYKRFSGKIEEKLGYTFIKHILNSAGIVRHKNSQFDMVRLGIGLYGIDSSSSLKEQLKNVSTLKTIVSQIKILNPGETVGYNRKGEVLTESKIATVGIGYADGYRRSLSNGNGKMMIKGKLAPVIGNVCMDMTMLDITHIDGVKEGDEVIVFGDDISPSLLAQWSGTIAYEIISTISQRVKRVYYQE